MSNLYDEVTGTPDVAPLADQESERLAREVEAANAFEGMYYSAPFQKLLTWIADQIDACKDKLVDENDPAKIVHWQQKARAFSDLIGHAQGELEFGKSLKEEAAARKSEQQPTP